MNDYSFSDANMLIRNAQAFKSVFPMSGNMHCIISASILTAENINADCERLKYLKGVVKKNGIRRLLPSNIIPLITAEISLFSDYLLALNNIQQVLVRIDRLFSSSPVNIFAALIITRFCDPNYYQYIADRAYGLYSRQKVLHPFMTSKRDVILFTLMALSDFSDDDIYIRMEKYLSFFSKYNMNTEVCQELSGLLSVLKCHHSAAAEGISKYLKLSNTTGIHLGTCLPVLAPVVASGINSDLFFRQLSDISAVLSENKIFSAVSQKYCHMFAAFAAMLSLPVHNNDPDRYYTLRMVYSFLLSLRNTGS